jgi:polysaccharide pyruvyl transferase WcaK-like protein
VTAGVVEVKGIGFPNKGAELMLLAVRQEFERRGGPHRLAYNPYGDAALRGRPQLRVREGTLFAAHANVGLLRILPDRITRGVPHPVRLVAGASLRSVFGLARESEVAAVLDASGFAYGDVWGAAKPRQRLGNHLRRWKRAGRKLVLLPQAFGPFTDPALREVMQRILEAADLVFARDATSLAHLRQLGVASAPLLAAPDFTCLVEGWAPARAEPSGDVCVIPNAKMVTKGGASAEAYAQFMADLVRGLAAAGLTITVLVHEGEGDERLARDIVARSGRAHPVVRPSHAQVIKGVIGRSRWVVSSRFHGLVSALTQGVPVLATGWSHKYQELLGEFALPDALLEIGRGAPEVARGVDLVRAQIASAPLRQSIEAQAAQWKRQTAAMWDRVFEVLAAR